jgi:hypothetical protein
MFAISTDLKAERIGKRVDYSGVGFKLCYGAKKKRKVRPFLEPDSPETQGP